MRFVITLSRFFDIILIGGGLLVFFHSLECCCAEQVNMHIRENPVDILPHSYNSLRTLNLDHLKSHIRKWFSIIFYHRGDKFKCGCNVIRKSV